MGSHSNESTRWGRIVAAAVMSEVAVMALLMIVMGAWRFVIAPGRSAADYATFNDAAAYYVAPLSAGFAVFAGALWACRAVSGRFVRTGVLVGLVAVALTGGFIFFAKPEDRLMYGVSYLLRIAGGWAGGVMAQRARARQTQSAAMATQEAR